MAEHLDWYGILEQAWERCQTIPPIDDKPMNNKPMNNKPMKMKLLILLCLAVLPPMSARAADKADPPAAEHGSAGAIASGRCEQRLAQTDLNLACRQYERARMEAFEGKLKLHLLDTVPHLTDAERAKQAELLERRIANLGGLADELRKSIMILGSQADKMVHTDESAASETHVAAESKVTNYAVSVPMGKLEHPIGTYLKIEGVRPTEKKGAANALAVDKINGKTLDQTIHVWVENVGALPMGERCVLTGYESGRWLGTPPDVTKNLGDPAAEQIAWGFHRFFLVISADEPKELKERFPAKHVPTRTP